jgi:hypothetical protein
LVFHRAAVAYPEPAAGISCLVENGRMNEQPSAGHLPSWLQPHPGERRLPVALVIVVLAVLQWLTPRKLTFEPRWLLPVLELVLLALLVAVNPYRINRESLAVRAVSLAVVAVASFAVLWSTGRLIMLLAVGDESDEPETVLLTGAVIWVTTVGIFALWYWELDRGGPAARASARREHSDFLFPQMTVAHLAPNWKLSRLPLPGLHERHRIQPDPHLAAQSLGEVGHDATGVYIFLRCRGRRRARGQRFIGCRSGPRSNA